MFNTETLLERLNKVSNIIPNYHLSFHTPSATHRPQYSFEKNDSLQLNIKKILNKKPKRLNVPHNLKIKTTYGTPRKHHCLELIHNYVQKANVCEPKNISIFSTKVGTSRPSSHRISNFSFRSPQKSPKTKHIFINIPTAVTN